MFDYTIKELKLDEKATILELCCGTTSNGEPFFAYLNIPPSKYVDYKSKQENGESIDLAEFGDIICTGWGEEPSADIKKEVEETYGADHTFQEKFLAEVKRLQEETKH